MIEIEHDPRCWLAQSQAGEDAPPICTCEQIAQLEEQARSVLEPEPAYPTFSPPLGGLPRHSGLYGSAYMPYGTATYVPMGTYTGDPYMAHYIDHMAGAKVELVHDPGKVKVDELAAKRAEIYAKADAKTAWDPSPKFTWKKGKI